MEPKAVEPELVAEDSDEKPRVTYSRFKNVNDRRKEAEEEAEKWRQRALEIENTLLTRKAPQEESGLPSWWVELYGDSEASRRGWELQQSQNERVRDEAIEAATKAIEEQREAEAKRNSENLNALDEHLDSVSAVAGRDLTEKEQDAVLDIIDEYTPKDDQGNYIGLISPDKAWEIYELKEQAKGAPKKQSRDSVAALTNPHSEGQPDGDRAEKDKSWNPLSWDFMKSVK